MVFLQICSENASKILGKNKVVISYNYFRQYLELVLVDIFFSQKNAAPSFQQATLARKFLSGDKLNWQALIQSSAESILVQ